MKQNHRKVLLRRTSLMLAVAGFIAAQAAVAAAGERPSLDGTWKITAPRLELAPNGGADMPLTNEGRAAYENNKKSAAKGDFGYDQTATSCSSPGLPRMMLSGDRIQIFQRDRVVNMLFEWNRQSREIEMRDVPEVKPLVDTMYGVSYGHWEGDTLVVKSFGFFADKLIDAYLRGSDALELVEKIRLKDKDTLEDRITVTDPAIFTRPFETVLSYKRQKDEALPEDNCLDRKQAGQPALPL
ncbi:hypothetical protein [Methylocella silvestris]|uniref:Lipocalin-like domain-containing protein n=1 Tax=Methylocella silvestris TaxID=199596 RepID=A0A2J7TCA2_METSI|nr:hypothetical protein [Methylocella silvestris]PNG24397.1 hypothetical protein CR492_19075 [Methylocella silvestris]